MKHILTFTSSLALSITLGCGGDIAGVKMKDSLNKGNPDKSAAKKPAPPLGAPDRTATLFNELNRIQRTLMNLSSPPPEPPAKSCVKYTSTPKEKGIFLVARYDNCHWTQELSGEKSGFIFAYRGREEYTNTADKAQARVTFDMAIARASAPRISIARSNVEHLVAATGHDKTKSVVAESVMGSEAAKTADYWKLTIADGEWLQTGPRSLIMKKGSAITWTYRPANSSKSTTSPSFKLILSASEDISFANTCPWPIKGAFELREVDQNGDDKISQIEVNAKGYTGPDKIMHAWPTDHCLGVGLAFDLN